MNDCGGAGRHHGVAYTLGTSTRSMEEFLDILSAREITMICDVRSSPSSRRYPHFSRRTLSARLEKAGIGYTWLGESLGGHREDGYAAHMRSLDFVRGLERLEELASREPTAMVCAELFPWKCHRRFISAALEDRGWKVVHIIDKQKDWIATRQPTFLRLFDDDEGKPAHGSADADPE
jgi:uncharacterized protein (DUF488 family)